MKQHNSNIKRWVKGAACGLSLLSAALFTACTEDIDQSNRYTFTGETVASYLLSNPEQFSSFTAIMEKAGMMGLLSSYGSYTCFAPTNEAVARYLVEKDSLWQATKDLPLKDQEWTGILSPSLDDLLNSGYRTADSMCVEIARTHLIEEGCLTTDLPANAIFPRMNMNDRVISVSWTADTITGATSTYINSTALVLDIDHEVENGVIQVVAQVLSPSTDMLPDLIDGQPYFSIFAEALFLTGLDGKMREYRDDDYAFGGQTTLNFDKNRQCPYPKTAYFKYTAFVESDSVFINNGINDIDDLKAFARKWYGDEDAEDYTSSKNALNKFISYHILDRQLQYASGSGCGGFIMQNYTCSWSGFNSEVNLRAGFDRYDYFETFLGSLVKVTKPLTNTELKTEIVLNYAQDKGARLLNSELANHINVIVLRKDDVKATDYMADFKEDALNGIIHPIDRIMVYNEDEMSGNVLYERMRWDFSSLFSELTNNNIRWAQKSSNEQEYILPKGYCKRMKINSEDCNVYYLCANGGSATSWTNYQGDEFIATKTYDFEYRLPHVPAGNYELRFGYNRNAYRGVGQFYVDGKVAGIPVDLRQNTYTNNLVGWTADTGDEDEDRANDKAMRNRGYMKGPDSYCPSSGVTARSSEQALRKLVGIYRFDGEDHWIRFKNVLEGDDGTSQFMHDYLEIVPKGIITDVANPEDRH